MLSRRAPGGDRGTGNSRRLVVAAWIVLAGTVASGMIIAALIGLAGMKARDTKPPVVRDTVSPGPAMDLASTAAAPHLVFVSKGADAADTILGVAPLQAPGAGRALAALRCERVSFAAGRGICLQAGRGLFTRFRAVLFDERFEARTSFALDGRPSRTRISTDGRVGAITVFVTGQEHGYTSSSFSTRTTLVDMSSGDVLGDLEQFATWRDGTRWSAPDFNFWGVTFARDSNTFYASLQSARRTYLVRGDLGLRTLTVLHENVECPSLSPDNKLIAYKKRVAGDFAPWRFHVLDLATMTERPLAETRSIDDQIEWLDDGHVLYGTPRSFQSPIVDVYVASIEGNEPARVFLPAAESPIVVR